METLLNLLELVRIIEGSSSMLIDDLLASRTHKRSKVMMQFMERQSSRSTPVNEQSAYVMTRYNGGTREDLTNIHAF